MIDAFPTLDTPRLRLRPLAAEDVDFVLRHFSDADVQRYLLDSEPVSTVEHARGIVSSYVDAPAGANRNRWVLELREDGRPVGTCGFHVWSRAHRRAEIGYDLQPACWGRGLMTEALEAALDFGFGAMELNRVQALVHPGNEASVRILERMGFRKEAMLRDYFRHGGRFHDHWQFALLAADRKAGRER